MLSRGRGPGEGIELGFARGDRLIQLKALLALGCGVGRGHDGTGRGSREGFQTTGSLSREFTGNGARDAIDGRGYTLEGAISSLYDSNILREGGLFGNNPEPQRFRFHADRNAPRRAPRRAAAAVRQRHGRAGLLCS